MRHFFQNDKCSFCDLVRIKQGRGKNTYWTYHKHGVQIEYENLCISKFQTGIFETPIDNEILDECSISVADIEESQINESAKTIGFKPNQSISERRRFQFDEDSYEMVTGYDVPHINLEFDIDGTLGDIAKFKVYVISTIRIPQSLHETIDGTYNEIEKIVEMFKSILPKRPSVIVAVDKNEKLYKAWQGDLEKGWIQIT